MALQGDSYPIKFFIYSKDIKTRKKVLYTSEDIAAAQFMIGEKIFKEYPGEDVIFDDETSTFGVRIHEEETFGVKGELHVQARIKFTSGNIIGKDLGLMSFDIAQRKELMGDEAD